MSSVYTPAATFPVSYVIPDDGDPKTASSVNIGLEAVGDRTEYLYKRGARQLASYAALRAITTPADGDRVLIPLNGDFVFQTAAAGAGDDEPLTIAATDGTLGAWVNSELLGFINSPNGVPRLNAYRLNPVNIPKFNAYVDAVGPITLGQSTASMTDVDVTGTSMSFTGQAGDIVLVEASIRFVAPTGGATSFWKTVVDDPALGTSVAMNALVGGPYAHKFKYVLPAGATRTITVKGRFSTNNGAVPAVLEANSTCVSVLVSRP